jgi:hypothetical protein
VDEKILYVGINRSLWHPPTSLLAVEKLSTRAFVSAIGFRGICLPEISYVATSGSTPWFNGSTARMRI